MQSLRTKDTQIILEYIQQALIDLRARKPLVLNLTNHVVMNPTANAILAIGASPMMSRSIKETKELISLAKALVVNIGTLDEAFIETALYTIEQANRQNKPVIFDPVGCGASELRTSSALAICQQADKLIIRGNASEILALAKMDSLDMAPSAGVDAKDSSESAILAAITLREKYKASVIISGEDDYVVCQHGEFRLSNGDALMPLVTGTGCTHTALIGAFAGVGEITGIAATAILGVCGELAAKSSQGPGSLQVNLLDALYQIDVKTLQARLNLEIL